VRADVLVVGAGPAGAATALELARAGAVVRLVDKGGFPRHKPCGDGLTPRALAVLDALGVSVPRAPAVRSVVVRKLAGSEPFAEYAFKSGPGTVLGRFELDAQLVAAAVREGVELCERTTGERLYVEAGRVMGALLRTPGGQPERVLAPLTVLAEGSIGALARTAPIPAVPGREVAFAIRRYFEDVEWEALSRLEILLPVEHSGVPIAGYGWIFPMADGRANVGVGRFVEAGAQAALGKILAAFEQKLLGSDPRFRRARPVGRPIGAPIRIGSRGTRSHAPGLLVVGDAAGLANPYWGEGISAALESGRLAAEVALRVLAGESESAEYGVLLARRAPNFDRFAPSLGALYRNLQHVARDTVPFLARGSRLSDAFFETMDVEPRKTPQFAAGEDPLEDAIAALRSRARRIAGRDRPVFGELVDRLDEHAAPATPVVALFFSARARFPGFDSTERQLRRAAVALELLRLACHFLAEVPDGAGASIGEGRERGGPWLAATLALCAGDRLLARSFALTARLAPGPRRVVAAALCEVVERLAARAVWDGRTPQEPDAAGALAAAAVRAGARLGGASEAVACELAGAAVRPAPVASTLNDRAAALARDHATSAERVTR